MMVEIITYTATTKREPFIEWLEKLDAVDRPVIRSRLNRIRGGNFADCKPLKNGEGVWEFRIDYGPGYRIYFGKQGAFVVVLLYGGDKDSL